MTFQEVNDDPRIPLGASLMDGMMFAEDEKARGNDLMSPQDLTPTIRQPRSRRPVFRKRKISQIIRRAKKVKVRVRRVRRIGMRTRII